MTIAANTPVIIGVGQRTRHPAELPGPEPLLAWHEAAERAAADAGLSPDTLRETGFLALADCFSWVYDDPLQHLADRIGAAPAGRCYSEPSGTAGQAMLDAAMAALRAGQTDFALICGGESMATRRLQAKRNVPLDWSFPAPADRPPTVDLQGRQHPGETAIGLFDGIGAVYTFAMRDIARRAHLGMTPEAYRERIGAMMAGMTRVAAANPNAWFREARTPEFLTGVRPDNRMIAYPYTKHMVSIMDVDIAAALIVTTEAKADSLGIPREKRVYPWATVHLHDPVSTAVRPDLWKSEGMELAARSVTAAAGITLADVRHVDLYSCFSAAVQFGADALGIDTPQGAQITVTGGLPYAGGPASSYMVTSLVAMTNRLRADPGAFGICSGVGMMMTNHAYGLYSTRPPAGVQPIDNARLQARLDAIPQIAIAEAYAGPVTIATYTIMYDRNGRPTHGAAICDLPDGRRAYARMLDPTLLDFAEREEIVGRSATLILAEGAGELRAAW
jgi:acetyl-CoA C-acetyltransferase